MTYCRACGKQIPDASPFCNLCGAKQESIVPAAAARHEEADGVVFTLRPTMVFIVFGYAVAIVLSLAAAALIARFEYPLTLALGVAAALIVLPVARHVRRQCETYTLTPERIEIRTGLWSRTTRSIPLGRIQDVTTTRSLGERLLRIGDIEIDSAAETGKCFLRNVPSPAAHAAIILEHIKTARQ